jgi:thiamine monophosphate synthase
MSTHHIADRIADGAAALPITVTVAAMSIQTLNAYLQAGAFIVAMVSGICAAVYYVVQTIRNRQK